MEQKQPLPSERLRWPIFSRWILAAALAVSVAVSAAYAAQPGDVNGSGSLDPGDIFYLASHLYAHGPAPEGDADFYRDDVLDQKDVDALAATLFEATELAAATIDQNGGTIEAGGFKLEIPPGALTRPQQITVESAPAPADAPDALTRRYFIGGLPEELNQDITISLPLLTQPARVNRLISDPSSIKPSYFMVATGPELPVSEMAVKLGQYFIEAYLTADKVVAAVKGIPRWLGDKIELFSVLRISLPSDKGYFQFIVYQEDWDAYAAHINFLSAYLDRIHDEIAAATGMPWSIVPYPIRVIFNVDAANEGQAVTSNWSNYMDYIVLNRQFFREGLVDTVKATLAHELTHLLQGQYDPRWSSWRRNLADWWNEGNMYLDWNEAVATWASERFGLSDRAPTDVMVNALAPFSALYKYESDQAATQKHGYGMASLIKQMADTGTPVIIGDVYKDMRNYWFWNNGKHPVTAILDAMSPGSPDQLGWWSDYFISLLQGSIYQDLPLLLRSDFSKGAATKVALGDSGFANTPSFRLPLTPRDLSATPVIVALNAVGENAALTFGALGIEQRAGENYVVRDNNSGIMAFKMPKVGSFQYLAGSYNEPIITVEGAAALRAEESSLLLLLLNSRHQAPYTGTRDVDFEGHLGTKSVSVTDGGVTFDFVFSSGVNNVWQRSGVPYFDADFAAPGTNLVVDITVAPSDCNALSVSIDFFNDTFSYPAPCGSPLQLRFSGSVPSSDPKQISATWFGGSGIAEAVVVGWY